MNILYPLEVQMRKEGISLLFFDKCVLQKWEKSCMCRCSSLPDCQSLKMRSSWWLSHSFFPLGRPVSFHSSALLEMRFWCQYREEICFTKGHNLYTYECISKYLPLRPAHILAMLLYNRTRDRIFWTSYYINILFSHRCTWNLPPFKIPDYWVMEDSTRPEDFSSNVLQKMARN